MRDFWLVLIKEFLFVFKCLGFEFFAVSKDKTYLFVRFRSGKQMMKIFRELIKGFFHSNN